MANREAVAFTTDANTYNLDSVQLVMSRLLGNASDLTLSLCSDAAGCQTAWTRSKSRRYLPRLRHFHHHWIYAGARHDLWIVAEPNDWECRNLTGGTALHPDIAAAVNSIPTQMPGDNGLPSRQTTALRWWFTALRCRSLRPSHCLALVPSLLAFCSAGVLSPLIPWRPPPLNAPKNDPLPALEAVKSASASLAGRVPQGPNFSSANSSVAASVQFGGTSCTSPKLFRSGRDISPRHPSSGALQPKRPPVLSG